MNRNRLFKTIAVLAGLGLLGPAALAQCVSSVPAELNRGESACVQVCASDYTYPPIILNGTVNGPGGLPILLLTPGCSPTNSNCNVNCTPIVPPAWPFIFGGDPWYPNQWYGESDCMAFYLYWVHDAVWALEIYTDCNGCFCLTYDDQLPVSLSKPLTAVAGVDQVTLSWVTASETNTDRFEVLRTDRGTVAALSAQGSDATGHSYAWVDRDVTANVVYTYTLVAVDLDGTREELGSVTAAVRSDNSALVTEYALYQNYPNPFNPTTRIEFDMLEAGFVTLKVFNPMGVEVASLVNGDVVQGRHSVVLDGRNLASGLYFYALTVGDRFSATRKMLLVK